MAPWRLMPAALLMPHLVASAQRPCLLRACLCLACCPLPCAWRLSTQQEKASQGACGIVSAASWAVLSVLRKSIFRPVVLP